MTNKKCLILFTLVFAAVCLFGYVHIWAQDDPQIPCETERVFDDQIKVRFNATCEHPINVWFCDVNDPATGECTNWGTPVPHSEWVSNPILCTCSGSGCTDDLQYNIDNQKDDPTIEVDCHPIQYAGLQGRGCPIYGSLSYLVGYVGIRRILP